jgi:hypothetical protein
LAQDALAVGAIGGGLFALRLYGAWMQQTHWYEPRRLRAMGTWAVGCPTSWPCRPSCRPSTSLWASCCGAWPTSSGDGRRSDHLLHPPLPLSATDHERWHVYHHQLCPCCPGRVYPIGTARSPRNVCPHPDQAAGVRAACGAGVAFSMVQQESWPNDVSPNSDLSVAE